MTDEHKAAIEDLRTRAAAAGLLVKFDASGVLVIVAPEPVADSAPPAPVL